MIPAPNLALIGFMAAGKTTVGQALSSRTGLPFHDVDLLVERSEGLPISDIFAARGEPYFREVEGRIFRDLCAGEGLIIACGGGTLIDPRNRAALEDRCVAVWLKTSLPEIMRRIGAPGAPARPLGEGAAARLVLPSLLSSREDLYRGAELVVDTDGKGIDAICDELSSAIALLRGSRA
ncbi:MAG: shikimate kinase [Candidatus Eisenbacteria bacterium]|nr:shikimate kinase [Candidatus Eisenbacteria bacterium]